MHQKPIALEPLFVRKNDVERLTGLSRSTIERMMRNGVLRFRKQGRAVLIDYSSVREYHAAA